MLEKKAIVRCLASQSGMGYVGVLALLAIMSTLALTFMHQVGVQTTANHARLEHMQIDYLAQSAANHAVWRLLNDPGFAPDPGQYAMHAMAGGRYGYKVRKPGATTMATIATVGARDDAATQQSYVPYIIPSNIIAAYGRAADPLPEYRRIVGAGFSDPADTLTVGSTAAYWMDVEGCPLRREVVLAAINDLGVITVAVWDGTAWGNATTLGVNGDRNFKCFDIAYESQSGRTLAVGRHDASTTAYFNIWDGTAWVHPTSQPAFDISGGAIRTVTMASCPGNDHILIATICWNNVLELFYWNGTTFTNLGTIETSMDSDDFGAAVMVYERQSGDALLIWASRGKVRYRIWDGLNLGPETIVPQFSDDVFILRAAGDPNSDQMMVVGVDKFYDITLALWDGDNWVDGREIETSAANNSYSSIDVAWETTGQDAIAAWAPWGQTYVRAFSWTKGTALSTGTVHTGPNLQQQPWLVELQPVSQSEKIVLLGMTNTEVLGYSLWTGNQFKGDPAIVLASDITVQNDRAFDLAEADVPITGGTGSGSAAANQPPMVDAGPDLVICQAGSAVKLSGTVTDDGLPPPGLFSTVWSLISGPGDVKFENIYAAQTGAVFAVAGEYVLRLTADDSELAGYDEVSVTVGPSEESLVNIETSNDQSNPAVAVAPDGRAVIVWSSKEQDGDGWGVYAQRYDADGNATGPQFLVNTATAGHQQNPAVAMDDAGNYVIAWQTQHVYLTAFNIYAQRFDAGGVKHGSEFRVDAFMGADMVKPSVAMAPTGEFVIAFEAGGGFDGQAGGIYARRYDATGVGQGGGFKVNTYMYNDQKQPSVAMDDNGNFVVVWESFNQDGSGYGVYGQRYDAAGTRQGAEFQVNTTTISSQGDPSVSMINPGFVVVWEGYYDAGSSYDIYLQRFAGDGTPFGGETIVNAATSDIQLNPAIHMNNSGNFVVTWQSNNQDGWGNGVFGHAFNLSTVTVSEDFQVNTTTTYEQIYPAVGVNDNNRYIITWSGNGAGDNSGVFMKNVCLAGSTKPVDGIPPEPDPMIWANPPAAVDSNSITMTATTASDDSGVQYYFECTSVEGHDSGWQTSAIYVDSGLSSGTSYVYRVKARDTSGNQNETGWSIEAKASTTSSAMYVADIAMAYRPSGQKYYAQATVWIKSAGGADLEGAVVSGDWSGAVSSTSMGVTDANGQFLLESPLIKSGLTATFTVTGVVKTGYAYTPGMNVETSESITIP